MAHFSAIPAASASMAALARKCLDARVEDCRAWKKEISRPRGGVVWVVVPPVPPPAEGGQSPDGEGIGGTAALAQKCLGAKGLGCEAWEKEIDARVAALYGL